MNESMFEKNIVGAIYVFRNKINGKCYVGQSINFEERYKQHIRSINKPVKSKFARALRKYGEDGFDYFIVYSCVCSKDECKKLLDEQEKHFIEVFDSYKHGYNMTLGGEGNVGLICSDETRRKLSESHKGKPTWNKGLNKETNSSVAKISKALSGKTLSEEHIKKVADSIRGKHHTEETKIKISNGNKGKYVSEETRNRLSKSLNGKQPWNKGVKGCFNEETRKRMSEWQKGRHLSEDHKRKISEGFKRRRLLLNDNVL